MKFWIIEVRDRDRDQIKRVTGTWIGTGTKKSWSRTSLIRSVAMNYSWEVSNLLRIFYAAKGSFICAPSRWFLIKEGRCIGTRWILPLATVLVITLQFIHITYTIHIPRFVDFLNNSWDTAQLSSISVSVKYIQ